jgi:hypothetical protein
MSEMGSKLVPAKAGMHSCRVTRPKDGMISQKGGHRSTFLTKSHRQPPVFDAIRCKISLDKPKVVPLYSSHRKAISYQFNNMNLKDKGLVILSGCAHAGIVNTVRYAMELTGIEKIHALMGGFHLGGPLFEPIINRTTEEIKAINPTYVIPAHCTGRKAIMAMEKAMPDQFILNMSGTKLTFA